MGSRPRRNGEELALELGGVLSHENEVRGGGAVRGARGQVEKELPDSSSNRGDAAKTFEFAINFFLSMTKLVDGSIHNIQRDTIVKREVDSAEIDPNELQSMEEKAVRKLVEKIGEIVLWGPEQEVSLLRYDDFKGEYVRIEDGEDIVYEIDRHEGWASLRAEFFAELVDMNIDSKVGYVPSHLAMQKADDDWASQRHIVPIITDMTVIADGANAHAEEGNVAVVDWNAVELEEPTDLVIAPIVGTDMAKLFGIPVDDRDEDKRDESNTSDNDDRELSEDVDEQFMEDAADDVDDAHDEELVHVYDKETPVIRVGKLCPNMDEFRLSFKTYAVTHQFDAKTFWTDRKKFYAKCRGFDGSGKRACKWRKLPSQLIVVEQSWPTKRARVSGSRRKTSQWLEQFGAKTEETAAGVTGTEEIVVKVQTVETTETEVVVTKETDVQVHTIETEETKGVHTEEFDQTESAIEFHEMFTIDEPRLGGSGILVRFRNPYDAYHLLDHVRFGGCEFICFTTYNFYTDLDNIWPNEQAMHTLPYNLSATDDEE
ncbi:Auxin-induced protein 5NG4 [Hordeum vulgare]|nr:Auxin-induced protein 5NG4 [Hordeum vulgare]